MLLFVFIHATGLVDEQQKVRTISALAIAALAEAATPYGIESFDSVLKPLWKGIRQHRGKVRGHLCKTLGNRTIFACSERSLLSRPCNLCWEHQTESLNFNKPFSSPYVTRVWLLSSKPSAT